MRRTELVCGTSTGETLKRVQTVCPDVFEVSPVGEIDDGDDRRDGDDGAEAGRLVEVGDDAGGGRAPEIRDGSPEEVCAPRQPDRLAVLQCSVDCDEAAVTEVLHDS